MTSKSVFSGVIKEGNIGPWRSKSISERSYLVQTSLVMGDVGAIDDRRSAFRVNPTLELSPLGVPGRFGATLRTMGLCIPRQPRARQSSFLYF